MNGIKNVIFDLGGVLVDLDLDRCIRAFNSLGMPQIAQIISPYYPAEMIGQLEHGDISWSEMCDMMRAFAGRHDVTDEQIAWAYGEFLTDVPLAKMRMVEALRAKGIRTYVLSNNNPASMEVIRRYFTADGRAMEDYFDHIYLSYQLRALKPSAEIFHKIIEHSGIKPGETLFIDDGLHNVNAARELGFEVYMPAPGEDCSHLFDEVLR